MGFEVFRRVLDVLLPPQCLTCDVPVTGDGLFCAACFTETAFISAPCCTRCGVPMRQVGVCEDCEEDPPAWGRAQAALRYDAQARRVVLPLKYSDRPELAQALAPMMLRAGAEVLGTAEVLVPVPMHRRRLMGRGYNQAALLAQAVGRLAGKPVVVDGLRRTRMTRSLGTLGAEARAEEVIGVFAVRRVEAIAGRRVLLIDDVLTSGATCGGCAQVLLAAGAVSVNVLVAARAADPRYVE